MKTSAESTSKPTVSVSPVRENGKSFKPVKTKRGSTTRSPKQTFAQRRAKEDLVKATRAVELEAAREQEEARRAVVERRKERKRRKEERERETEMRLKLGQKRADRAKRRLKRSKLVAG